MSSAMTKMTVWAGLIGLLIRLAVSAYAHDGDGFQTDPSLRSFRSDLTADRARALVNAIKSEQVFDDRLRDRT